MHQAGLIDHAIRKSRERDMKNPCSINDKNRSKQASGKQGKPILLKLHDFGGAFLVLGIGFVLAFVAFIAECIVKLISVIKSIMRATFLSG